MQKLVILFIGLKKGLSFTLLLTHYLRFVSHSLCLLLCSPSSLLLPRVLRIYWYIIWYRKEKICLLSAFLFCNLLSFCPILSLFVTFSFWMIHFDKTKIWCPFSNDPFTLSFSLFLFLTHSLTQSLTHFNLNGYLMTIQKEK